MTERPDRPLVVKCAYDSTSRRIAFPSASKCRLAALRARASECFHLSALSFHFIYIDDDGEEFDIREEADLTEAILYFEGGGDDASIRSGAQGALAKVQMKVEVVVEYDGPSLSDTSSLRSYSDVGDEEGEGEEEWGSSYYTESWGSSISGLSTRPSERDRRDRSEQSTAGPSRYREGGHQQYGNVSAGQSRFDNSYGDDDLTEYAGGTGDTGGGARLSVSDLSLRDDPQRSERPLPPLTGPDSAPAPALLTHSELGSRWLKEQKDLAKRKLPRPAGAPSAGHRSSRIWDSDSDSLGSDERVGDIALVKDERGRYYYSYETESAHSQPSADPSLHHLPLRPDIPVPGLAIEPGGPPILAPDCSACGVRLEYMRYVCTTCGEGDLWKASDRNRPSRSGIQGAHGNQDERTRRESSGSSSLPSPSVSAVSDESDLTEWAGGLGQDARSFSGTMDEHYFRGRSASMSTRASQEAVSGRGGSVGSSGSSETVGKGYELCPSCIEVHGINHAKAAVSADRRLRTTEAAEGVRRRSELRHCFREKFWGLEGWTDIEYNEEAECTICRTHLLNDRYKCVSCTKFDLCQACYHRVGEIHPAHAFLSLPDRTEAQAEVEFPVAQAGEAVSQNQKHPGVFCHNCMQDIHGPRFHCAVCPSWDLCSQCESLPFADGSGHTADHIMMKIPVPIPTAEVDAVSRRARSRWIEQDSGTIAAQSSADSIRARSPSPTEGTVYAGGAHEALGNGVSSGAEQNHVIAAADNDHQVSCSACGMDIRGTRYECVNCPTLPTAYNLCSTCEVRSFRVHNPLHAFLRFDRPVPDILRPVPSTEPLLPIILRDPAGHIPRTAVMNGATNAAVAHRDPTAYLSHILHRETLCDVHCDQIRGVWLRCVHCVGGFDCCAEGEASAGHDPRHVFLVFKARVDMKVFRRLAGLDADRPRALINHRFYL